MGLDKAAVGRCSARRRVEPCFVMGIPETVGAIPGPSAVVLLGFESLLIFISDNFPLPFPPKYYRLP